MIRALCVACPTSHASYRIVLRQAGTNVAASSLMDDSSSSIEKRKGRVGMFRWQRLVCQSGVHRDIGTNNCTGFQAQPQPCRRGTKLANFTSFCPRSLPASLPVLYTGLPIPDQ
ncbi:hypothetical protein J3458_008814 [Metarhizium acridum]|uniref:uncharacterized protein n=1 Tax=Metarhizium acridum TaxID=92637 RepID=UPI001C6C1E30|nr:hypothetical protein J3458_008814 [Metarhizium acridum]